MEVLCDEGLASHIGPEFMRSGPRGPRRSVDRGACRPAIEPRQTVTTGCRRGRATRKATWTGALLRAPVWTPRGRRPRHARKLLVREPGDLSPDRPEYRAARIGKAGGPKPMMHGREKSDPAVVAMKPANVGGASRGRVGGAKGRGQGEGGTGGTYRTPCRARVYFQPAPSTARVHFAVITRGGSPVP